MMTSHRLALVVVLMVAAAAQAQDSGLPSLAARHAVAPAISLTPDGSGGTAPNAGGSDAPELPLKLVDPEKKLNMSFTPYMWLTSLSGNISVKNINFNATASFVDILQNTNGVFGLMGAIDAEIDRLVFQLNGAWSYMKVNNTRGVFAAGSLASAIKIDSSWTELFGGYRFIDQPLYKEKDPAGRFFIDGFVGGRLTTLYLDSTVTASAAIVLPDGTPLAAGASREIAGYQAWVEPFVGARIGMNLCGNWTIGLRGDVGGFGVSGDTLAWQAIGMVGYTWHMDSWNLSLLGGVRALSQDYSSGGFRWNETVYGPALGVQFSFAF
ncbi:MAG: hypothetical protein K8R92_05030 [Planctomycetes bacterium]|nr:hypothetical protein [Planctomycetota bacterium]